MNEEEGEPAPAESAADEAKEPTETEEPKHYYDVDMTITPQPDPNSSGTFSFWEPGEFIFAAKPVSKLDDFEDSEVGYVEKIQIWDGNSFGPDDPGKYPGQQRLLVTFVIKPGAEQLWIHYYNNPIGQLKIPAWSNSGLRA